MSQRGTARRGELDIPRDPRSRVGIAAGLSPSSLPRSPPPSSCPSWPPAGRRDPSGALRAPRAARHGQPPLRPELPVSTAAARVPARPAPSRPLRLPRALLSPARFCLPQAVALAGSLPASPGKAHCAEAGAGRANRGRRLARSGRSMRTDLAASAAGLEGTLEFSLELPPRRG